MIPPTDPVALAQALIRCRSITPADDGALAVVEDALQALGFVCHRLVFEEADSPPVGNLYARLGKARPNLAFAGHTDVVPPGQIAAWRSDPFGAELVEGVLYGRGAVDMKGAVACFIAATARLLAQHRPAGSISCLITGDEEGPAINGTPKLLGWLQERGEALDACLVGEPTNPERLGTMIKIGRRGSLTGQLTVTGLQGHSAYPERADNPIPRLLAMLQAISVPLDAGNEHFQPSTLAITSVDVDNPTSNVIPGVAKAVFNIRFNDRHTAQSLDAWLRQQLDRIGGSYQLDIKSSGDAFVTAAGSLTQLLCDVVEAELGIIPERSTSGGASDARFIKDLCPVVEFGLVGQTMHQVDECVAVADLEGLTRVYQVFMTRYFGLG